MPACPAPLCPRVQTVTLFDRAAPLVLASGATLAPVSVAYETFGTLNADRSNAIFICHALTGDSHVAMHTVADRAGWWDCLVGPGQPVDTDKYFVVCANVLGGCAGTTGPWSPGPDGHPYGPDFPPVRIPDMVTVHRALLRHLGLTKLRAVLGGSLGGMQALEWLLTAPSDAESFLIVAATGRQTADNLAWNAVARAAIRSDLRFEGGRYPVRAGPDSGLGVARMIGHLTYLSEPILERKFGRRQRNLPPVAQQVSIGPFAVEGYLEHQATKLAKRFDANTYLYLTDAMDHFDAFGARRGPATARRWPRVHLFSFASDRLYGSAHSVNIQAGLAALGCSAQHFHDTSAEFGHDAFLLDVAPFQQAVRQSLDETVEDG